MAKVSGSSRDSDTLAGVRRPQRHLHLPLPGIKVECATSNEEKAPYPGEFKATFLRNSATYNNAIFFTKHSTPEHCMQLRTHFVKIIQQPTNYSVNNEAIRMSKISFCKNGFPSK
jgi:hypothetical protein